jgi:hypothetical protein
MEDRRRQSDRDSSQQILLAINSMQVAQQKTNDILLDSAADVKKWRESVDNTLGSHTNQLIFLKGVGVTITGFLTWLGVDRVIGK